MLTKTCHGIPQTTFGFHMMNPVNAFSVAVAPLTANSSTWQINTVAYGR